MTAQAKRIGEVKGLGEIYQVSLPLDKQIADFVEVGIDYPYLPTIEDIAGIRIDGVSSDESRTSVAPIALEGEKTVLVKNSPLMNLLMAKFAVKEHRNRRYVQLPCGVYEEARDLAKAESGDEPEDRTAIILSQDGDYKLTPEMEEARFAFEKFTKPYFEKFTHGKIPLWNLPADSEKLAVVNYLWFGGSRDDSGLNCGGGGLYLHDGALGVLTAEGGPRKFGHDLTTIKNANLRAVADVLRKEGLPRLEDTLTGPLTEELINELRNR